MGFRLRLLVCGQAALENALSYRWSFVTVYCTGNSLKDLFHCGLFKECDFIWLAAKYSLFNLIPFNDEWHFSPEFCSRFGSARGAFQGRFWCKHWHKHAHTRADTLGCTVHTHSQANTHTYMQAHTEKEHQKDFRSSSQSLCSVWWSGRI